MVPFGVENMLLYYREKQHFSQEQVCDGICPKISLSRMEGGQRAYDFLLWETLLERMGKSADRFEFILDDEDAYLYDLRETIRQSITNADVASTEKYLSEYGDLCPTDQKVHQQFLLYYRARALQLEQGKPTEILDLLHRAIALTRPDFREKRATLMLFSTMEVQIIHQLFLYEAYTEESMNTLMLFMDQMYGDEEKESLMVPFLYLLAKRYHTVGSWHEVLRVAEKAIGIIRSGRGYTYLSDFFFYRVRAQAHICKAKDEWPKKKMELLEECNNLYYMYMIEESPEKMDAVHKFTEVELTCHITA